MDTLATVLDIWRLREQERITIHATDPETNEQQIVEAPAWLFRGENADYDATLGSVHRSSLYDLPPPAPEEILAITRALDRELQAYLSPMYSTSLLQHYFLPTEMIDLTSSVSDAGAFAAYRNTGNVGVFMAFPTEKLQQHGILVDLKAIHFAKRPRHQHAYTFFPRKEPNFRALFDDVCAKRIYFQGNHDDLAQYQRHYENICGPANTDPSAGLLNKILNDVVLVNKETGAKLEISCPARKWIEERIAWAPVPLRPCSDDPDQWEPAFDQF